MVERFTTRRTVLHLGGTGAKDFTRALSRLASRLPVTSWRTKVVILIRSSRDRRSLPLNRSFGPGASTCLRGKNARAWGPRREVVVIPAQRARSIGHADGVLAWDADDRLLEAADTVAPFGPVVAVVTDPRRVVEWTAIWKPKVYGRRLRRGRPLMNNRLAAAALAVLTSAINLSTGLDHPLDKDLAKKYLALLLSIGEWDSPSCMRRWARALRWRPRHARELESMAREMYAQLTVAQRRHAAGRRLILESWRHSLPTLNVNGWVV